MQNSDNIPPERVYSPFERIYNTFVLTSAFVLMHGGQKVHVSPDIAEWFWWESHYPHETGAVMNPIIGAFIAENSSEIENRE